MSVQGYDFDRQARSCLSWQEPSITLGISGPVWSSTPTDIHVAEAVLDHEDARAALAEKGYYDNGRCPQMRDVQHYRLEASA